MESSETRTAPKAGAAARIGAVILALVLLFVTAVAFIVVADIGDLTPCADVTNQSQLNEEGECFDGSSTERTLSLVFGWPGALVAALATLLALAFALRGRGSRPLIGAIVLGAVLLGLSLLIG